MRSVCPSGWAIVYLAETPRLVRGQFHSDETEGSGHGHDFRRFQPATPVATQSNYLWCNRCARDIAASL